VEDLLNMKDSATKTRNALRGYVKSHRHWSMWCRTFCERAGSQSVDRSRNAVPWVWSLVAREKRVSERSHL